MEWFSADDYELAREVLQRGIAAIYLVAFLSTAAQFRVLLGERGLLPVPDFVRRTSWSRAPSLFRFAYSDRLLLAVTIVGSIVAISLVLGLPQTGPPWLPLLAFLVIWALYLSIVNVGQTFYGFGWETLLLEAGFLAAFLGSRDAPPPLPVMILFWWLVFRLEFGAGMIKMRGDASWRDLTALYYHHETQPMPNPLSRSAHLLPRWFHRLEVLANHVSQLVVPFLLFVPGPVGTAAGLIVVATQAWLVLTGNFAWLNVLTMILAFSAVADPAWIDDGSRDPTSPVWFVVVVATASATLLVLSWRPLRNLFSRHQLMNASFDPLHLVNAYGAFGSVTTERLEVIVEGTVEEHADAGWREYEFRGKPGDPTRRPRQFAPYHLRLDWLMWFLALGRLEPWFLVFLVRLLEADSATLRLLRTDPFDGRRPARVRARLFLYRFATHEERRRTGLYWVRQPVGELIAPIGLESGGRVV
ncbi:lipase maturation factor family protein [Labedella phragmitis]|uniref:Lipase maturation factor family protein n=1 Tax=Labedella phragmitis TaxID=2498849 RepID=A0A444PUU9_9MICO|nr:lipase maturation factor family protein [Labedella phragmitis]RWZ51637.1 lipase maturation factor family protein [Labedella phragmitis]